MNTFYNKNSLLKKNLFPKKKYKNYKNKPLVSIITICLNSDKTIERTILSVINQTYQNIEYIIIDGGSIDNTNRIIKKYKNKISVYISEPDLGTSDATNKGIAIANGEFIATLSSDDWFNNNFLEILIHDLIKGNYDFIIGSMKVFNANGKQTSGSANGNAITNKNIHDRILNGYGVDYPALIRSRKILNIIGFYDLKLKYVNDWDHMLRLCKSNLFTGVINNKAIVNRGEGGLVDQNYFKFYIEKFTLLFKYRLNFFKICKILLLSFLSITRIFLGTIKLNILKFILKSDTS